MIVTALFRIRDALDNAQATLVAWQNAPDPLALIRADVHRWQLSARGRAAWAWHCAMDRTACWADEEAHNAYDGWVRLGQVREYAVGLSPDHPDSWFLSRVRGPHLHDEPCNAECEQARAEAEAAYHDDED